MNISYHLTEEEARDGLNGLLPKHLKQPLLIGGVFLALAVVQLMLIITQGFQIVNALGTVVFGVLGVWFLANRMLRVHFIARRSAMPDNLYMLTVSPEGWICAAKGKHVKLHGDDKAMAVETPLTVSIRPDEEHQYVIPKSALKGGRLEELRGLLEAGGCPVKKMGA